MNNFTKFSTFRFYLMHNSVVYLTRFFFLKLFFRKCFLEKFWNCCSVGKNWLFLLNSACHHIPHKTHCTSYYRASQPTILSTWWCECTWCALMIFIQPIRMAKQTPIWLYHLANKKPMTRRIIYLNSSIPCLESMLMLIQLKFDGDFVERSRPDIYTARSWTLRDIYSIFLIKQNWTILINLHESLWCPKLQWELKILCHIFRNFAITS